MASFTNLQHSKDPKETLSGEELLRLLMQYCNEQIRENSKIERQFSKDLTNDKIDVLMKAFRDGIAMVADGFHEHINAQKANLSEVELKLDTFATYLEQLVQTLSQNLETVTGAFNNHIKLCHVASQQHSCQKCGNTLVTDQEQHEDHSAIDHASLCSSVVELDISPVQSPDKSRQLLCSYCNKTWKRLFAGLIRQIVAYLPD